LSGGGWKRKTVDNDESDTKHTAKKSRGGEGGGKEEIETQGG
jgi:hypothetical protein